VYTPAKKFTKLLSTLQVDETLSAAAIELAETASLTLAAGSSFEAASLKTLIHLEYAHEYIFNKQEKYIKNLVFNNLIGLLSETRITDLLSMQNSLIVSLEDVSFLFLPRLSLQFSEEFSLALSSPIFYGTYPEDIFGQYRDIHLLNIQGYLGF